MFDFQKLDVYQKSKASVKKYIQSLIKEFRQGDKRSTQKSIFNIMLNIAEGTSTIQ